MKGPIQDIQILRINNNKSAESRPDQLAVEAPLQILLHAPFHSPAIERKNISITMRTPGQDCALAVGFLYAEGIINLDTKVTATQEHDNQVLVQALDLLPLDLSLLDRHFYTTSSCGVCGKTSLEAVRAISMPDWPVPSFSISQSLILSLPTMMNASQSAFKNTGGMHAVALFDLDGKLLDIAEDVGRHNAMDKLIGSALINSRPSLPLNEHILLLSGRASFELIQKAVMAGIKIVAAVGAPSSLAVDLAEDHNMTLIGFLRDDRFNVYSGRERLRLK